MSLGPFKLVNPGALFVARPAVAAARGVALALAQTAMSAEKTDDLDFGLLRNAWKGFSKSCRGERQNYGLVIMSIGSARR